MRASVNIMEKYIPEDGAGHQFFQVLAVFTAALGVLSAGALVAWTSPAIPILTSNSSHVEPITLEEASHFTIIAPVSTIVSAPILALLVDIIGRKKTIMVLAASYFLSYMLLALADSVVVFYLSRVLEGFGDAAVFTAIPMYIGEVTQPDVRGTWGNLMAFFGFLGQFLMNVIGSCYDIPTTALILGWIPLLQFFLMAIMPESPYFLLRKNKEQEARTSLKMLRWTRNIEDEFRTFSKNVQQQITDSGTFKDLFFVPTHRKTLLIGIGIRGCQQLSGLTAFFVYTQYMFNQAGGDLSGSTSAIIFTGIFVIVITTCSCFIGRYGRRPLMIFSCLGCGIVLAVEAVYFYINEKTPLDISQFSWVPLAGMIVFVFTCAPGLGIIPTLMLGELFATSVKGKAMCILNIAFSLFIIITVKLFQTLSVNFGMYVPFCIFSICCLANVFFTYFCVPETRGKTLEEIQQNIRGEQPEKTTAGA